MNGTSAGDPGGSPHVMRAGNLSPEALADEDVMRVVCDTFDAPVLCTWPTAARRRSKVLLTDIGFAIYSGLTSLVSAAAARRRS